MAPTRNVARMLGDSHTGHAVRPSSASSADAGAALSAFSTWRTVRARSSATVGCASQALHPAFALSSAHIFDTSGVSTMIGGPSPDRGTVKLDRYNRRHDPLVSAMNVERRSLLGGAADAYGIVIVIDVLRAFSCSALMFHYGIRDLALVRTPQDALAFRDRDPDYLVAGEVKGVKVEGFDLGNSPADIVSKGESFFRGRRVAARSSAGTQGVLAAAAHAEQVILGSYMTAAATAAYIRDRARVDALVRGHETTVTIVAMGFEGVRPSVEDERCGDYLEHLLADGGEGECEAEGRYVN